MSTPEQAFLDIVSQIESKTYVTDEAVGAIYDTLQPITDADFLTKGTGEWKGHSISTDHPIHKMLVDVEWAGKVFRSVDDVDPIMVYDEEGKREFLSKFGHAQLREVSWKGKPTIAMIYDSHPIIDYFHYVTPDMIVGVMDSKLMRAAGLYYFYLTRLQKTML